MKSIEVTSDFHQHDQFAHRRFYFSINTKIYSSIYVSEHTNMLEALILRMEIRWRFDAISLWSAFPLRINILFVVYSFRLFQNLR